MSTYLAPSLDIAKDSNTITAAHPHEYTSVYLYSVFAHIFSIRITCTLPMRSVKASKCASVCHYALLGFEAARASSIYSPNSFTNASLYHALNVTIYYHVTV